MSHSKKTDHGAEDLVRQALKASWGIVSNETNKTVRKGSNTICTKEIEGWSRTGYETILKANSWGLMGSMKDRTVRIQNNTSSDLDLWIGDTHSHTEQTLDGNCTFIWRFKGFHSYVINTQHWAQLKKGRDKVKFSVYGNGAHDKAPEADNTFTIETSKIKSSFGMDKYVSFL